MENEINENVRKAVAALEKELKLISVSAGSPMVIFREQQLLIDGRLRDLKTLFPFDDLPGEVEFCKCVYPRFKALKIYYTQWHELMRGLPVGKVQAKRKYYSSKLKRIRAFLNRYGFHYDYYQFNTGELDELLYGLNADRYHVLQPVYPGDEVIGVTPMALLVAKFIAFERLRNEVLRLMHELEPAPVLSATSVGTSGQLHSPFKWTGKTIDLIEVAHGLHLEGQINNGKAGIVDFFKSFGEFFGVDLGIPKKGMDNLMERKTMSRTRFTDKMRQSLHGKMDELERYDPDRMVRKLRL